MSNLTRFAFFAGGFMAGVLIVLAILIVGWAILPFILPIAMPGQADTPTAGLAATATFAPTPTQFFPFTQTPTVTPTHTLVAPPPTDTPILPPTETPAPPPTDTSILPPTETPAPPPPTEAPVLPPPTDTFATPPLF